MPTECPEQTQAQQIIIIHPGSLNLRIGRASDLNPHQIVHAVARRRKPGGLVYSDSFLPACVSNTKAAVQEIEECRLQVSHTLQSCLQSDGRRRYATPPQQIAAFNRRTLPEVLSEEPADDWTSPELEVVFGEEILDLNPAGEYNVHFPVRRGELNVHGSVGGSLTAVLTDLQEIWEYMLQCRLGIELCNLHAYKAVLVIPDIYNRGHLRELMNLVLNRIGFGSCFFVQDHVAATFGAGLGYACVVDVGDQKTSVSCVEDGLSHPNTRVRLDFGGADVTQTFHWLLKKCAFPYKELDDRRPQDAMLLKQLKEDFCHVNLDTCGSQEKSFLVCQPARPQMSYTLQLGDECIVAPLSLFHTELLAITGSGRTALLQKPTSLHSDAEDCFDAEYLQETGRKANREPLEQGQMDTTVADGNEDDIVVDAIEVDQAIKPFDKDFIPADGLIGLDQAVMKSIERCPTDELKRKMYGCILVVGGGMKFDGIGKWLQNRVGLQIPCQYRPEQLDIVTSPKDMDPAMTAWKGAAVMSCLESAPELWIHASEWQKYGLRILREKALFIW